MDYLQPCLQSISIMLSKIKETVFYYCYRFSEIYRKVSPGEDAFSSCVIIYLALTSYLFLFVNLLSLLLGKGCVGWLVMVSFYLLTGPYVTSHFREEHYNEYKQKYKNEDKNKRISRVIYLVCFMLGSILAILLPYLIEDTYK